MKKLMIAFVVGLTASTAAQAGSAMLDRLVDAVDAVGVEPTWFAAWDEGSSTWVPFLVTPFSAGCDPDAAGFASVLSLMTDHTIRCMTSEDMRQ